jgi:hypothetical protein
MRAAVLRRVQTANGGFRGSGPTSRVQSSDGSSVALQETGAACIGLASAMNEEIREVRRRMTTLADQCHHQPTTTRG